MFDSNYALCSLEFRHIYQFENSLKKKSSAIFQHVKLTKKYFRVTWETFKLLGLSQTKNCLSNLQVEFHLESISPSSQGFLENWKKKIYILFERSGFNHECSHRFSDTMLFQFYLESISNSKINLTIYEPNNNWKNVLLGLERLFWKSIFIERKISNLEWWFRIS